MLEVKFFTIGLSHTDPVLLYVSTRACLPLFIIWAERKNCLRQGKNNEI